MRHTLCNFLCRLVGVAGSLCMKVLAEWRRPSYASAARLRRCCVLESESTDARYLLTFSRQHLLTLPASTPSVRAASLALAYGVHSLVRACHPLVARTGIPGACPKPHMDKGNSSRAGSRPKSHSLVCPDPWACRGEAAPFFFFPAPGGSLNHLKPKPKKGLILILVARAFIHALDLYFYLFC